MYRLEMLEMSSPETWNWYAIPNVLDPNAENSQTKCPGYHISNVQESASGLTADLDLAGAPCNIYGTDIDQLKLTVEYHDTDRLHVEIVPRFIGPENSTWFIIPEQMVPKPQAASGASKDSCELAFEYSSDPNFSYRVIRKANNEVLFDTTGSQLVFADQFFEFVTQMPADYNLYGLGETIRKFRLGNNLTRTLWAADVADQIDANLYGSHPIYLDTRYYEKGSKTPVSGSADSLDRSKEYDSYTHGVFMRNAHGQDILLQSNKLTWRSLGGSVDLYFYSGPQAKDVITTYQKTMVGFPAMQQYWAFGFHQCRWGYKKWQDLQDVVQRMEAAGIHMETIWADIDWMDQYRNFVTSPTGYPLPEFAGFLETLHGRGQHFVPIIDAALYRPNNNDVDSYLPYKRGAAQHAFLSKANGEEYIGQVWPGYTVFPDFVGASLGNVARTNDWWNDEVRRFFDGVKFDGLWVDMNEVSSFCEGSCGTGRVGDRNLTYSNATESANNTRIGPVSRDVDSIEIKRATIKSHAATLGKRDATEFFPTDINPVWRHSKPVPGQRNLDNPPYAINHFYGHLAKKGVAPSAHHHVETGAVQYDFHNLFGHQLLNATHSALLSLSPGKRPFIIGRSTFAGSGALAGHWGGDNFSLWEYLQLGISQGLSFSIYGIPMFGTDACGFLYDSNEQLCARWMQLNAFFPFYRNHNTEGTISQEPYTWESVANATRTAIAARYAMLPYMYTLFYRAHTRGDTVLRALVWEFPTEPWLADSDAQFMLGPSLLVVPVLTENMSTVSAVMPQGALWYDWWTQTQHTPAARGYSSEFSAPMGHIPLFVRGGSVMPLQQPGNTTTASRANPWSLLVALDADGAASGDLYVDDGESLQPDQTLLVTFTAAKGSLKAVPEGGFGDANALANVTIMGVDGVGSVSFNGQAIDKGKWKYNEVDKRLWVDMESETAGGAWMGEWELTW
ncbi:hypothetical protein TD95_001176 [Thielaviopsis punctulata]|uniref:alpha-glucosidase n=1 Tax=Thielaviopsis punctulata TaxID=72032 RepID=A0A0F4ZI45_9PEZI|nr:hypothetical protein TD95_001176 [Thielaviopsis punctulata]